jgi:hypothetical protein
MVNRLAGHFGWISGIVFVILFIPSYLSAPDTPLATSTNQDVISFMTSQPGEVLTLNGVLLVFAGFFFLFFLGALHGALQRAEVASSGFPSTALVGGAIFLTLMLAGAAIEIMHPAAATRFQYFRPDAQLGFLSMALSGWMYRFAFVGMAAMIAATSFEALSTGMLPRWMAWAGLVAALAAILRLLGPTAGWLALLWIIVVCVFMLRVTAARTQSQV